jgi:hypothetical protein
MLVCRDFPRVETVLFKFLYLRTDKKATNLKHDGKINNGVEQRAWKKVWERFCFRWKKRHWKTRKQLKNDSGVFAVAWRDEKKDVDGSDGFSLSSFNNWMPQRDFELASNKSSNLQGSRDLKLVINPKFRLYNNYFVIIHQFLVLISISLLFIAVPPPQQPHKSINSTFSLATFHCAFSYLLYQEFIFSPFLFASFFSTTKDWKEVLK